MKLTAACTIAALALSASAQQDALNSISAHWSNFASVVNDAMPWLKFAPQPTVYNSLTRIFQATTIQPTYVETVVVQMASAMPDPLINNMLMRAEITGVTVSNHNFVADSPAPTGSVPTSSVPTSSVPSATPTAPMM